MKPLKLIPIFLALAAVMFSVPTVKSLIKGESINVAFLVLAPSFFVLAIVFFVISQKSGSGPAPPSA